MRWKFSPIFGEQLCVNYRRRHAHVCGRIFLPFMSRITVHERSSRTLLDAQDNYISSHTSQHREIFIVRYNNCNLVFYCISWELVHYFYIDMSDGIFCTVICNKRVIWPSNVIYYLLCQDAQTGHVAMTCHSSSACLTPARTTRAHERQTKNEQKDTVISYNHRSFCFLEK